MSKIPRLLPLIAVAIGGVVLVRAVGVAPGVFEGAQAWAQEAVPAGAAAAGAATAGAATGSSGTWATADEDEPRLSPGPQVAPCCAGAAPAEAGNVLAAPSPGTPPRFIEAQLAQRSGFAAVAEACLATAAEEERLEALPPACPRGTAMPRLSKDRSICPWIGPLPFVLKMAERTAPEEGPPSSTSRLARAFSNSSTNSALPLPAASISGHLAGQDAKFAAAFASSSHVQIAWQASR